MRAPETDMGLPGARDGLIDMSVNHPPMTGGSARRALAEALVEAASSADLGALLSYPPEGGSLGHRAAGAAWIARTGLRAATENVLVCSGNQHGMTSVLTALLSPGDVVLCEHVTYPGMKALAHLLHLRLQGLPMDEQGLLPDAFESACRGGAVKALYCVPTLQNPTTAIMSVQRRREVAAVARANGVAIIEDDVHGLLPENAPPPLAAFAPELTYYLNGTSKSLAPGLRIGYVLCPPDHLLRLASAIRTTTWMAAPLMAEIATLWIRNGTAGRILVEGRAEAAARQALAAEILGRTSYVTRPHAYHLWLKLPEPWRSETFAEEARRRGVAVSASQVFLVGRGAAPHAVRVCLGPARDRSELARGLHILAEILAGPPDAGLLVV